MQASSVLPGFVNFRSFSNVSQEMGEDFSAKLKLDDSESGFVEEREVESEPASLKEEEDKDGFEEGEDEVEEEEEEEEEEFSFVCTNPDGSPISAEDIFQDGQIRPIFPIFDRALLFADADDGDSSSSASVSSLRPPLRKLFVEDRDRPSSSSSSSSEADEMEAVEPGTYCEWSGRKAVEASPEMSKKSNSTGFSRFWRFRDLVIRSSSDGKDAFVFLNPNSVAAKPSEEAGKKTAAPTAAPTPAKADKVSAAIAAAAMAAKAPAKKKKKETASSAHERHYVTNRAKKEVDKRRSYLPYRPDLVGFFTNVNGLSRNVHPF